MNPTLFVAFLAKTTAPGTALTADGETPTYAHPLHLTLHTSPDSAQQALAAAAREEWDREDGMAYAFGPAADWTDERLLEHMRRSGYVATVSEQPVTLAGGSE